MNNKIFISLTFFLGLPVLLLLNFFILAPNFYFSGHIFPGYAIYDTKRLFELIILMAINIYLLSGFIVKSFWERKYSSLPHNLLFTPQVWLAILIIFGCGFVGAMRAPVPSYAFLELSLWFQLAVLVFCLATLRTIFTETFDNALLLLFTLCITSYVGFFIYQLIVTKQAPAIYSYIYPGFMNPRFFAQYQLWTLPLLPALLVWVGEKTKVLTVGNYKIAWAQILFYLISVVWIYLALLGGNKGMMLAWGMAAVFGIIMFRRNIYAWLWLNGLIFLGYVGFGISSYLVSWLMKKQFVMLQNITVVSSFAHLSYTKAMLTSDVASRFDLWKMAWHLAWRHPLFGVGPLHFAYYAGKIGNMAVAAHPHNSFFMLAAEWGLVATFLIIILFITGMWQWLKFACNKVSKITTISWHYPKEGAKVASLVLIGLFLSLLASALYSMVDGVLVTPMSQMVGAVVMGWMIGVGESVTVCQCDSMTNGRSWKFRVFFSNLSSKLDVINRKLGLVRAWARLSCYGLLLVLILVTSIFIIIELVKIWPTLPTREITWYLKNSVRLFFPRFWLNGFI